MNAYPHYFKALPPGCTHIDVYRVLSLFEVSDPALQHAVKKLLCAGARGSKDQAQDIAEAIATLQRWQQMRAEEQEWRLDAKERQINTSQEIQDRLDRIPVYAPAPAAAPEDAERRFGPVTSDPADAERNIRAKEDAERAAYLERWKDAPEDATHLAQDSDGKCWFYETRPILDSDNNWFGACALKDVADNLLGSVKCEPRPVQGVGP